MQTRWLCQRCEREWVANSQAAGADPWDPTMGCPGCRSAQIQEIRYQPVDFPGGDIPEGQRARVGAWGPS